MPADLTALGACGSSSSSSAASTTTTMPVTNGDQALQRLMSGNSRFVAGTPLNQGQDTVRRVAVADHQTPFAVILTCADSRVTPEIIFDEGIGDLFVARVAGNTADAPALLGSIEYGVSVLGSVLLMVLGHQNCGAVKAAVSRVTKGEHQPGHIDAFVDPIVPAVQAVQSVPSDQLLDAAIHQNIHLQVSQLSASMPLLAPAVSGGKLKVVGGEYHLDSGKVELVT